jgi:hypothetical protein
MEEGAGVTCRHKSASTLRESNLEIMSKHDALLLDLRKMPNEHHQCQITSSVEEIGHYGSIY